MPRFSDIPKLMRGGSYTVDVALSTMESWLAGQGDDYGVELDPDFQRGHVWTDEQRSKYVEFVLRGGQSQLTLYWNHPAYTGEKSLTSDLQNQLVLVDGKQRLTACLKFLRGELAVFGHYLHEFNDPADCRRALGMTGARLKMNINNLQTRADLLKWYLDLNDGGVVHSREEIERVKQLLAAEEEACHAMT